MTDNEIIKALEGLANVKIKYGARKSTIVDIGFLKDALDLIKYQQAEIERYKDLEEAGRLITLPCKVGDTVWFVGNVFVNDYEVRRYIVDEADLDCIQVAKLIDGKDYWNSFSIYEFGKTVFLTKEEAEAKLKELVGANNDR